MPVFCMVWMLPIGKMVIFPGVRVSLTRRAPFSASMYVVVVPSTATTRLVARACRCAGSIAQGPRLSMARVMPRPVSAGKVAALALITEPGAYCVY